MTTCSDLIEITRNRYLLGGMTEQRNKLLNAYTAGGTTLVFKYPLRSIQAGSVLSVGLNTFYVWEVDGTQNSAIVDGGYNGSVDSSLSAGTNVRISARYPDFDIFTALNEELLALSSPGVGLFQMKTVQFSYSASRAGYDLPGASSIIGIYDVRYDEPDSYSRTPRIDPSYYRLERDYSVSENSSTYSLKLMQSAWPGRNVTVQYKAPFTPFTAVTDNVTVTGVPTSALDIVPMGAALRLGVGKEVRRNQIESQGDTRRAEEVPAGAVGGSFRGIAGTRAMRISEELSRLAAAYPVRI